MADFEEIDPQTYRINKEVSGLITYVGFAINQDAANSDPKWMIKRIAVSGGATEVVWASQKFDQIWDNRNALFGAPPFDNENSLLFDGINDFASIGDVAPLQFDRLTPFSVSFWVRSTATGDQVIFGKQGALNSAGYRMTMTSGRLEWHMANAGANRIEVRSPLSTYNTGTWHHVVWTYSGSSTAAGVLLYVDGASVTLGAATSDTLTLSAATTIAAMMGARNTGATNSFTGFLDEVSVFDVAISLTDVTNIYNAGVVSDLNQHAQASNLIAWWRNGDNDTFPTVNDRSDLGNNLHATMTNMTADSIVGEVP